MEKVKEFVSNPKKTAIVGLIGSIISLNIAFIIYFIIVFIRMYKKKGSIKVANYIVIINSIIEILMTITILIPLINMSSSAETDIKLFICMDILKLILSIIYLLFFFNILFKKSNFIDNNIFAISSIVYVVFVVCSIKQNIITSICQLTILPYFYNYYELLKGEKENG